MIYWIKTRLKWWLTGRRTVTIIDCDIICKTLPPYDYSTGDLIFYKDGAKHVYEKCSFIVEISK